MKTENLQAMRIPLEPPFHIQNLDPDDERLASNNVITFIGDKRDRLHLGRTLTPAKIDGPTILSQPNGENEGVAVHGSSVQGYTLFVFSEGQAPAHGARIPMQQGVIYGIGSYDKHTPDTLILREAVTLFTTPLV